MKVLLAEKTYPEILGLDVKNKRDWFPWFIASALFAKPIPVEIARRTVTLMLEEGVTSPRAIEERGWDGLVAILDAGGYVRYDFSTADKLLDIAKAFRKNEMEGWRARGLSATEIERLLTLVKGVGPKTAHIFMREMRGSWRLDLPFSEEALRAATELGLDIGRLKITGKEKSRLESVLVRIWLEHCKRGRWHTCPAGRFCRCGSAK